jgi:hypothetical protein
MAPMRGSVGGPIAMLAAILAAVSAFVPFWNGAKPYELAMRGLWQGFDGLGKAAFITSLAMILLVGTLIMLASSVAGSQALSFIGFVWLAGFLATFVYRAKGPVSVSDFLVHEVDWGFWVASTAALLALIATFIRRSVKDDFKR